MLPLSREPPGGEQGETQRDDNECREGFNRAMGMGREHMPQQEATSEEHDAQYARGYDEPP